MTAGGLLASRRAVAGSTSPYERLARSAAIRPRTQPSASVTPRTFSLTSTPNSFANSSSTALVRAASAGSSAPPCSDDAALSTCAVTSPRRSFTRALNDMRNDERNDRLPRLTTGRCFGSLGSERPVRLHEQRGEQGLCRGHVGVETDDRTQTVLLMVHGLASRVLGDILQQQGLDVGVGIINRQTNRDGSLVTFGRRPQQGVVDGVTRHELLSLGRKGFRFSLKRSGFSLGEQRTNLHEQRVVDTSAEVGVELLWRGARRRDDGRQWSGGEKRTEQPDHLGDLPGVTESLSPGERRQPRSLTLERRAGQVRECGRPNRQTASTADATRDRLQRR